MDTILITGANGFIGGALTRKMLNNGYRVIGIITSETGIDDILINKNFKAINISSFAEYKNLSSLIKENVDIVFHFAWQGLCGNDAKNVDYQLENIDATITLFNQMKLLKMKKFIFASTMNTLDVRHYLDDSTNIRPRPAYIHSGAKLLAELYIKTLASESNIEVNVGYIAMAFGPENYSKMVPNIVISKILNNESVNLIKGDNSYDLIYIDDIANAFVSMYEKGVNMKSYYIGHVEDKSFREIFTEVAQTLSNDTKLNFGFYKDDNNLDYSLIKRDELFIDTGWTAKTTLKEGVLNTAKWIKENHINFF